MSLGERDKLVDSIQAESNVTAINNEFIETLTLEKKMARESKMKERRRLIFLLVLGAIILVPMAIGVLENVLEIRQMETNLVEANEQQKQLASENQQLQVSVSLLQDENYIAKLARSRYYLSKDGEIIFSLPEDNHSKAAVEKRGNE